MNNIDTLARIKHSIRNLAIGRSYVSIVASSSIEDEDMAIFEFEMASMREAVWVRNILGNKFQGCTFEAFGNKVVVTCINQ